MDSDLWISRLIAAKRHYSLQQRQNSQSDFGIPDRLAVDEFEVEDEARSEFSCPFCCEDHDISSLCTHLEDEHSFESKVAVCPVCSVKVASDILTHITLQHGNLFKISRCRRLRRLAIPSSQALSLLGRDLRETHLQVLFGSGAYRSSNPSSSTVAADSYLSALILNIPASEAEDSSKSSFSTAYDFNNKLTTTITQSWKSSFDQSLSYEEREQKRKQATVRAKFVQKLLLSTLFGD
ncbi:Protein dehydration-induced 19 [Apostasia shenzhenica]|uniref:Protein dehydration-induced 19 n=1 Tax=Apostasia shenzhenica TaxID=1088818 RepID=A0A2I0AU51_9ASPA|nr:Protein dehydration-induced 19 [Apostasia shenzhenica]